MFHKSKLMFWTSEVLLLTIIFFIWRQMGDMITPIVSVVNTILIPFLVGGFLYYITNPLVKFLQEKLKINRMIGILITLSLLFGLIALGVIYLLPILINQLSSLINSTQGLYWEIQSFVNQLSKNPLFRNLNIQSTIQPVLCGHSAKYPQQCDQQSGQRSVSSCQYADDFDYDADFLGLLPHGRP